MDILIANPFFPPYHGGTEKVIYEVGRRLSKKHSITILTARLEGTLPREEMEGMDVVRLPSNVFHWAPHPLPPPVPIIHGMHSWMGKFSREFEIVHVHNRFVFDPRFGRIAKENGNRLCLTLHNSRPHGIDAATDILGSLYDDAVAKRFMLGCDGIAAVSDATMKATVPRSYADLKKVIYNGVDPAVFSPRKRTGFWKEELGIGRPMVLTNARLVVQKGISHLIEAMRHVDADLLVFGRGPLKSQLEEQAKAKGVRAHFLTRRLSDRQLAALYSSADVFALPSLYEPCSVALIEAMGCGLPCVVSDAGGSPELVQHGESGFVVPARNPKALAQGINALLEDRKLARRFGSKARRRVLSSLNWDRAASEYGKFYSALCASR